MVLGSLRKTVIAVASVLAASCGPSETASSARTAATPEAAVRVFAASSLTDVLKTISDSYVAAGHPKPLLNFAASSELARQIEHGGNADVFISADEAWMDYLAEKNLIEASTRKSLLSNSLVLIAPAHKPITVDIGPGMDLAGALKGGKLAIANPDNVPAGKYAKEALEMFGAWEAVAPMSARTENVRGALRFVEAGEAAAGIVYATDAKAAGAAVVVIGEFPPDSHTPITYPAAIGAGKNDGPGKAFLEFLGTAETKSVFASAGFGLP
ncbi:MAG: molybdate ABC transporter substrate-binding protein [Deltaproteobacteria bacterium]|nr:molybdate ABC transporter substrate-binding protein [Deltaproteobacteria bacterium]